jgi:hypothetical protein
MSRDLLIKLIEAKRALYEKEHALALQQLSAKHDLAASSPQDEASLEKRLQDVRAEQLEVEAQIKRAHLFGPRYARSLVPTLCIVCFVEHNRESLMEEVECRFGNGFREFECSVCSHRLQVRPE